MSITVNNINALPPNSFSFVTNTGWKPVCIKPSCDPGGTGIPSATSQSNGASPSLDGQAMGFSITAPPLASGLTTNALWAYIAGVDDAAIYFSADYQLYFTSAALALIQAAEIDMFLFSQTDNKQYMMGTQYDFSAGHWDVWNGASGWAPTGVVAAPVAGWNHIQQQAHRVVGDTTHIYFDFVTINGVTYWYSGTPGVSLQMSSQALPSGFTGTGIQWQIDANSVGGTSGMNLDEASFTASDSPLVGGGGGVAIATSGPNVKTRKAQPAAAGINFRPIQAKHITPEGLPELQDMWREAIQAINANVGRNGPVQIVGDLNMNGHVITGLGTPSTGDTSAALSQSTADPMYSTATQQSAFEAVGTKMLQTTRRLNDGTQQHRISSDLNGQGSVPPSNITGTLSWTTVAGSSITWTWTSIIIQYADLSYIGVKNGTLTITGLANVQYDFFPLYDTKLGILSFVADAVNGVGIPPIAIPSGLAAATTAAGQRQNADGRIALTATASGAQVTINGGSGNATLRARS